MSEPQFFSVDVALMRPNPWNSNRTSPENELKIRESLRRNGMFKPIIVRQEPGIEGYQIIGGQHRWEQAIELGWTSVPVVNLGFLSDVKAKEIGVIDNARYGVDDTMSLAEILKDIGAGDELQTFLPYGETDIEAIFGASDLNLDDLDLDTPDEDIAPEREEAKVAKPEKTHAVLRFRVSLADAERITELITRTRTVQGFHTEDDLTNAGDALVFLLMPSVKFEEVEK